MCACLFLKVRDRNLFRCKIPRTHALFINLPTLLLFLPRAHLALDLRYRRHHRQSVQTAPRKGRSALSRWYPRHHRRNLQSHLLPLLPPTPRRFESWHRVLRCRRPLPRCYQQQPKTQYPHRTSTYVRHGLRCLPIHLRTTRFRLDSVRPDNCNLRKEKGKK